MPIKSPPRSPPNSTTTTTSGSKGESGPRSGLFGADVAFPSPSDGEAWKCMRVGNVMKVAREDTFAISRPDEVKCQHGPP